MDPAAAVFVARFAEGWAGPDPDRLLALLAPDVRLRQPLVGEVRGRAAAAEGFFAAVLRFLPDLRLAVDRAAVSGDTVFIEWTATATLGGRPLRWSGVDRFVLAGGRAVERVAYFDALPLVVATLRRPFSWLRFWRSGVGRPLARMFALPAPSADRPPPGADDPRRMIPTTGS